MYEQMKANVQRQREADAKTAELLKDFDAVRTDGMPLVDCDLTTDRYMRGGANFLTTRSTFGLCKQPKIYPQCMLRNIRLLQIEVRAFLKFEGDE